MRGIENYYNLLTTDFVIKHLNCKGKLICIIK